MRWVASDLYCTPNPLAQHYRHFKVDQRLLLTGHSHQAWPDVARQAQLEAYDDAALAVDDKWDRAFAKADRVREGFRQLLDDPNGLYSLSSNTHELLVRFLSSLPLRKRPKLVTTDGEFHSLRRQLARLSEESIEIVKVPALPAESVGERLAAAVDEGTAAVLCSSVFFLNAHIAGGLEEVAGACRHYESAFLIDTYHQLGAVPFSLRQAGLEDAFVVGGGYKYLQLGEGNCFLRFPADCRLRPVITGWYAEFDALAAEPGQAVAYSRGDQRFAGATYDPTSHYRAAAVFDFFEAQGLSPSLLRELSQHQIGALSEGFKQLRLDPWLICGASDVPLERLGGFLAFATPYAERFHRALKVRGVLTDFRGKLLRLGPAPYLSRQQIDRAVVTLGEVAKQVVAPS